jgi:plasmid stabilization system protein ParE
MAEVRLTRRALFDIEEIDLYSIEQWGDNVAAQYLADLYAGASRLGESPDLLKERPETSLRLRFYRVREHVLVCDVIGDVIFVLALRAAVMDLPNRIAELEPQLVYEAELLARKIEKHRAGQ